MVPKDYDSNIPLVPPFEPDYLSCQVAIPLGSVVKGMVACAYRREEVSGPGNAVLRRQHEAADLRSKPQRRAECRCHLKPIICRR
jgi:hypothetical protein